MNKNILKTWVKNFQLRNCHLVVKTSLSIDYYFFSVFNVFQYCFLILFNVGWMVDLARGIFLFLTVFLVFWQSWDPWIFIRNQYNNGILQQIDAIPPSVQVKCITWNSNLESCLLFMYILCVKCIFWVYDITLRFCVHFIWNKYFSKFTYFSFHLL